MMMLTMIMLLLLLLTIMIMMMVAMMMRMLEIVMISDMEENREVAKCSVAATYALLLGPRSPCQTL